MNKPLRQNLDYFIQDSKYPNAFINLYYFLLAVLPPWFWAEPSRPPMKWHFGDWQSNALLSEYTILSFCPSQQEKASPDPFVLLESDLSASTHRHLTIRFFFVNMRNKLLSFLFKIEYQVFEMVKKYLKPNSAKEKHL